MDGPPAQSLGVEPVDPAVMLRPPRSRAARVLTRPVFQRVLTSAALIVAGTLLVYVREMSADGRVTARDTTMTFTCFVLFDMFNALTCRAEAKSVLRGQVGLLANRMFNYAVLASLAGHLAVINVPFLQRIFQTEALSLRDLLGLVCLASSVFWVDEARKYFFPRSHAAAFSSSSSSSRFGARATVAAAAAALPHGRPPHYGRHHSYYSYLYYHYCSAQRRLLHFLSGGRAGRRRRDRSQQDGSDGGGGGSFGLALDGLENRFGEVSGAIAEEEDDFENIGAGRSYSTNV
jgi:uncharacterized membrane protein YgcG